MKRVEECWLKLEKGGTSSRSTALRVDAMKEAEVFAILEADTGHRACQVEIPAQHLKKFRPTYKSSALFVGLAEASSKDRKCVLLRLQDSRFREAFTLVVQDILDHALNASNIAEVGSRLEARLEHWIHCFESSDLQPLEPHRQRGLWAELDLLQTLAISQLGQRTAVESWLGPEGGNQDFIFPRLAVEVKSSAAEPNLKMRISNVLQLDPPGPAPLFIYFLSLAQTAEGMSLADKVSAIRSALDEQSLGLFERKLQRAGYLTVHESEYSQSRFDRREVRIFHVRDGFPRLREAALPKGVGGVKYAVEVSACSEFEVEKSRIPNLLNEPKGDQ